MSNMQKKTPPQVATSLSVVQAGLSTTRLYQLIKQAWDAYDELDVQRTKIPKEDRLQKQLIEDHQELICRYQDALARVGSFIRPDNMNDAFAMLMLINDRLEDLVENDHEENGFDIKAELFNLRRMVRGCLPIAAVEVGVELDGIMQHLCRAAFSEVAK